MKNVIYKIALYFAASPVGSLFFKITKNLFKDNKTSKLGKAWWYGYLLNFACHYDLEKLKKNNKNKVAIRKLMPDFDWFKFYNTVFHIDSIAHIIYELAQGNIPYVDDTWHVWQQMFKQPLLDLEEGEKLSDFPSSDVDFTLYTASSISNCKKVRKVWYKLINDFSILNINEKNYIDDEIKTVLSQGKKVLGVVCRGTDYNDAKWKAQPDIPIVIEEVKLWMKKYGFDKVYLATEDKTIFEQFEKALPGQILTNKRSYYDEALKQQGKTWIGAVNFNRENDNYLKGIEYLSSIYILSSCNALLAGHCGASGMALLLNGEKYERFKVYKLKKL